MKRGSTWWLLALALAGLARSEESTALDSRQPGVSTETEGRSGDDRLANEFSVQAWLLFDPRTNKWPAQDSSHILKRITPKSVFIAPVLPACAEGYQEDTMHRCTKNTVAINTTFHLPFLLKRLEQVYNKRNGDSDAAPGSPDKQSSGPFQLNIPLVGSFDQPAQDPTEDEHEETEGSMEVPVFAMAEQASSDQDAKKQEQQQVLDTVYEVQNRTDKPQNDEDKEHHEEQWFFLGNKTAQSSEMDGSGLAGQAAQVVRITDLPDDDGKAVETTPKEDEEDATTESDQTEPTLPTLLLILTNQTEKSNTEVPGIIPLEDEGDLRVAKNDTISQLVNKILNVTSSIREKENESEVDDLSQEDRVNPSYGNPVNRSDDNALNVHGSSFNDSTEPNFAYDDVGEVDYSGTTDLPEEESTDVDAEEILKHGETGMAIPVGKTSDQKQRQEQGNKSETLEKQEDREEMTDETESTEPSIDKVVMRFNDSASTEKDEIGSNVSSEVSINGDFILETTLLNVNTAKNDNITATNMTMDDEESEEDLEDVTDLPTSQPEIILSPQDTDDAVSTDVRNRKRTEQIVKPIVVFSDDKISSKRQEVGKNDQSEFVFPERYPDAMEKDDERRKEATDGRKSSELIEPEFYDPEDTNSGELMTDSSSSEALLYDLHSSKRKPQADPMTEIHTIDERPSVRRKATLRSENPLDMSFVKPPGAEIPVNGFRPTPVSFRPLEDYVTFPSESSRATNSPTNYVKFPAEEANSILSQDYKDRLQYPPNEFRSSTSTKSSIPGQKQPPYWWVSQDWRADRLQAQQVQPTSTDQQMHKNRPMLWSFLTRTPLARGHGLYPPPNEDSQTGGFETQSGRYLPPQPARRFNFYKEMSSEDVNRLLAQKARTSIAV